MWVRLSWAEKPRFSARLISSRPMQTSSVRWSPKPLCGLRGTVEQRRTAVIRETWKSKNWHWLYGLAECLWALRWLRIPLSLIILGSFGALSLVWPVVVDPMKHMPLQQFSIFSQQALVVPDIASVHQGYVSWRNAQARYDKRSSPAGFGKSKFLTPGVSKCAKTQRITLKFEHKKQN